MLNRYTVVEGVVSWWVGIKSEEERGGCMYMSCGLSPAVLMRPSRLIRARVVARGRMLQARRGWLAWLRGVEGSSFVCGERRGG